MLSLGLPLVLLLATSLAAQTVHQVGPGAFAQIQTAINAASNGDTLVVQSGTYQPFTLAKDLTITAAPGANVDVVSTIPALTLLQPPTQARLVGLRFRPLFPVIPHLVRVLGGHVAISDCTIDSGVLSPVFPALLVQNARVAMQRCAVFGGLMPTGTAAMTGADAVRVVNASLAAVDCTFQGGDLSWDFSGPGGHGLHVDSADVHLVRCNVLAGGNSPLVAGNAAGDGVHVASSSHVWIADSLVRGGDGHATAGSAAIRNLGSQPMVIARTTLLPGPGSPPGPTTVGPVGSGPLLGHGTTTPGPVLGTAWTVDYLGTPTTPVLAVWSDRLDAVALPPLLAQTAWLPLANFAIAAGGVTDAGGALPFVFPLPATPALLHLAFFMQGVSGLALPLAVSPPVGGVLR